MAWVLEESESRLGARHVLISIANHAKADGTGAWPSIATIAHESRLSEREVQLAIPKLEALGELRVDRGVGPKGTHLYSMPLIARGEKSTPQGGEKPSPHGVKDPQERGEGFSPEPPLNRPKEPSNKRPSSPSDEAFDRFWTAYPRKVAKVIARRAWAKVNPEPQLVNLILGAVERQKQSAQWRKSGGQFIPHPATYLNQRRWEDQDATGIGLEGWEGLVDGHQTI